MRAPNWLWLLLLWAGAACADYKSSFDAGRIASERQEWERVQAAMRQALAEQPTPSASTRINGFAYLPKFYLGLAAFSLNQCAEALVLLQDAATLAAMSGLKEAQRQQLMVRSCTNRIAAAARTTPATPPTSTAAIARPTSTAAIAPSRTSVAAVSPTSPTTPTIDPKRIGALRERLVVIDANLDGSTRVLSDSAMAGSAATWRPRVEALSAQVRQLRGRISAVEAKRDVAGLTALEREFAGVLAATVTLKGELGSAQQSARSAAQAANAAAAAQQRELRTRMGVALKPMLQAWFTGDYATVASWRGDSIFDQLPDAKAQALILRAAGRHAQYVLTGERNQALADQARADILEARRLSAQVQPSARAYSPRFRSFFASAR